MHHCQVREPKLASPTRDLWHCKENRCQANTGFSPNMSSVAFLPSIYLYVFIYIYVCVYQYPWGVQASKLCLFSMNEIHNPGFDVQHDRRPFRDRLSRRKFPVAGPLPVTLAAQKRWNCPCHVGLWIFWRFKSVVWGLLDESSVFGEDPPQQTGTRNRIWVDRGKVGIRRGAAGWWTWCSGIPNYPVGNCCN